MLSVDDLYIILVQEGMAAREVKISSARAELFELFDEVTGREGAKVIISRRSSDQRAVLVSETYLDRLERAVSAPVGGVFQLFGSMVLVSEDADVVDALRAEQRARADEKLDSLRSPARTKRQ